MTRYVIVASILLGCSGHHTTQQECNDIADWIRIHGGTPGICVSTKPADVEKFGKACADLKACNDRLDNGD